MRNKEENNREIRQIKREKRVTNKEETKERYEK